MTLFVLNHTQNNAFHSLCACVCVCIVKYMKRGWEDQQQIEKKNHSYSRGELLPYSIIFIRIKYLYIIYILKNQFRKKSAGGHETRNPYTHVNYFLPPSPSFYFNCAAFVTALYNKNLNFL